MSIGFKYLKPILFLGIGALFSKVLGFIRQFALGFKFGTSEISDAFLLTTHIPEVIFGAIVAAISINFIPAYMTIEEKEKQDSFTSNLLNILIIFSLLTLVCAEIFPKQIVRLFAFELPAQTMKYAIVMLRINMFLIIPLVIWHIFQAYSQANKLFITTALVGNVMNVVIVIAIIFSEKESFYWLSVGNVLAHSAVMIVILVGMRGSNFTYHWTVDLTNPTFCLLCRLSVPLALEKLIWSMNLLVDRNLASSQGIGVISSLTYASLLANAIGVILLNPIITVAFPVFAELALERQMKAISVVFWNYMKMLCCFLVPGSIYMIVFSRDIVICVLQHGAIDDHASSVIANCLLLYAPGQILFWGLQDYFLRFIYAMKGNWIAVQVRALALSINVLLSIGLSKIWGYKGIVIATSISYLIACILLANKIRKKYDINMPIDIGKDLLKISLCTIIASLSVRFIGAYGIYNNGILALITESVGFFIIYLILINIFMPEIISTFRKNAN